MRHQNDRQPLLVERIEKRGDLQGILEIEIAGRFVGEEYLGFFDDCPGDGDALLLAPREIRRVVGHPVRESEALQNGRCAPSPFAGRRAVEQEGHLDVLQCGSVGD